MSLTENWLPVRDYPDYEVSDLGRVWSHKRGGRYLKTPPNSSGRPIVEIRNDHGRRLVFTYRLVLEAFVGPCPPGKQGLHKNDVKTDNRLENLRWGTPSDNAYDRYRNGFVNWHTTKDECPRGHLLIEANLVPSIWREGRRTCWSCQTKAKIRRSNWELFLVRADARYRELTGLEPNTCAAGRLSKEAV